MRELRLCSLYWCNCCWVGEGTQFLSYGSAVLAIRSCCSGQPIPIAMAAADYDRAKDVQEFDDSKLGVKGLLDSGITAVPRIFHRPSPDPTPLSSSAEVPTIDLSLPRAAVVPLLAAACREWGFFQVTNHGVPLSAVTSALSSVRSFHDLPADTRAPYYSREVATGFSYSSNVDLYTSAAATWRDTLQIRMAPNPVAAEAVPEVCRAEVFEWDEHVRSVADRLMGLLAEGLGVEEGRLREMSLLDGRLMACHYYPRCPQPELTLGLAGHSDPGALTLVVQNEVKGLQLRKKGEDGAEAWVDVVPIPGALVVNVGDFLQMISNDEYKSVVHRVVANPQDEPRVSIAVFFNPGQRSDSDIYGPLPELTSEAAPPRYRNFTVTEFMTAFFQKQKNPECAQCKGKGCPIYPYLQMIYESAMTTGGGGRSSEELRPTQITSQIRDSVGGLDVGIDNINMVSETQPSEHFEGRIPSRKMKDKGKRPRPHAEMVASMMRAFESTSSGMLTFLEKGIEAQDRGNASIQKMVEVQEKD